MAFYGEGSFRTAPRTPGVSRPRAPFSQSGGKDYGRGRPGAVRLGRIVRGDEFAAALRPPHDARPRRVVDAQRLATSVVDGEGAGARGVLADDANAVHAWSRTFERARVDRGRRRPDRGGLNRRRRRRGRRCRRRRRRRRRRGRGRGGSRRGRPDRPVAGRRTIEPDGQHRDLQARQREQCERDPRRGARVPRRRNGPLRSGTVHVRATARRTRSRRPARRRA